MKNRIVLLLTGSVKPLAGLPATLLTDVEERQRQYIDTLRYYIEKFNYQLVFVENSGVDFSSHFKQEILDNKMEFLTFSGNNYNPLLGKGFGELNCLRYAVEKSVFIKDSDFIFKITGRYRVTNLNAFYKIQQKNPDIYLMCDTYFYKRYADSRFFGFCPAFVTDYLIKFEDQINDSCGKFFEHILFKAFLCALMDQKKAKLLPLSPRIIGIAGSMNLSYKSGLLRNILKSFRSRIKYMIIENW